MLTASERANVVKLLKMKKSKLEISKIIKRDHRTVKRFTNEGNVYRKQHKSGRARVITSRDLRKIKRALSQNPHCTSKDIFDAAGLTGVSKRTRNRILNNMADQQSPAVCPPLIAKRDFFGLISICKLISKLLFGQTKHELRMMALTVGGEVGSKRTQVLVCGTNVNKEVVE